MNRRASLGRCRQEMEESMFVFTAKLNRKSAVAAVVVLALLLIAVILLVSLRSIGGSGKPAQEKTGVADEADAARYLTGLGWQVDAQPLEIRRRLCRLRRPADEAGLPPGGIRRHGGQAVFLPGAEPPQRGGKRRRRPGRLRTDGHCRRRTIDRIGWIYDRPQGRMIRSVVWVQNRPFMASSSMSPQ